MSLPATESFVVEAEQDVLGSMLLNSDLVATVRGSLRKEHFVEDAHQGIYEAILSAVERYRSSSPVIVSKLLHVNVEKRLRALNTNVNTYLARLAGNATISTPARAKEKAKAVVEQWARLSVAAEAERLGAAAMDPSASVADIISSVGQTFDSIMSDVRHGPAKRSRVTMADAVQSAFLAAHEAAAQGRGLTGISWGLADLNMLTGGMQRRDLTLVGARPSMGKTTFASSVGLNAAKKGHGVLALSLEMDREKLAARAASDLAYNWGVKVPYVDIIRGTVSADDLDAVVQATRDVGELPFWIDDQAGITITDVRVKLEATIRAAEEAGQEMGVLMIDHLGLIRASSRYAGNRTNEIAEMTSALKSLAREYDVAVVLLSQLNRQLEQRQDRRPQLSDLRDSGAIEQDSDTIMFLHREAYYLEREKGGNMDAQAERMERLADCQNKLEIDVAKQRNGPIRRIDVFADMGCAAIRNAGRQ